MSFRHSLIAVALATALLAGCGKDEAPQNAAAPAEKAAVQALAPVSSAAGSVDAQVKAFRNNDLKALLVAALPAAEIERMRGEWDKNRQETISEEDRAEFAENWGKLTAPDGVDKIMAEIEPQLAQMKPQMAGMIAMVQGGAQMSIAQSTDLTESQKAQATAFVQGLSGWLNKTDFTDPALMRSSLTALADGLRATGITKLDDIKALSFDQLLEKGGMAMGGLKNRLRGLWLLARRDRRQRQDRGRYRSGRQRQAQGQLRAVRQPDELRKRDDPCRRQVVRQGHAGLAGEGQGRGERRSRRRRGGQRRGRRRSRCRVICRVGRPPRA
ncbi:MAG: hypothetical protein AMXMBFR25_09300 [Lysobacterales bacterium]